MNIVTGGQVKPVKGVWKYRRRKKRAGKAAKTEPMVHIPETVIPIIREELTHYAKDFACGQKEFVLNEMRRRMRNLKRREGRA